MTEPYLEACKASKLLDNAAKMKMKVNLADFGFDFSVSELDAYFDRAEIHRKLMDTPIPLDFDAFLAQHRAGQPKTEAQTA